MPEKEKKNVLIADDHPLFINGLKPIIRDISWVDTIYMCYDGEEALEMMEKFSIQMLLLDVNMPFKDGIETLRELREMEYSTKVVVISQYGNRQIVRKMFRLGADGYLLKSAHPDEITAAVNEVMVRNRVMASPDLSEVVPEKNFAPVDLSDREMDVLKAICDQHTASQIAELLDLSKNTIDIHRTRMMKKANVHSIAGLVRWAYEMGVM